MPANRKRVVLIEERFELKAVIVTNVILKFKLILSYKAGLLWFAVSGHLMEQGESVDLAESGRESRRLYEMPAKFIPRCGALGWMRVAGNQAHDWLLMSPLLNEPPQCCGECVFVATLKLFH